MNMNIHITINTRYPNVGIVFLKTDIYINVADKCCLLLFDEFNKIKLKNVSLINDVLYSIV